MGTPVRLFLCCVPALFGLAVDAGAVWLGQEKIETWDNFVFIIPEGELQADGSHRETEDFKKWKALVKSLLDNSRVKEAIDGELAQLYAGLETGGKIIVTLEKGSPAAVLRDIENATSAETAEQVKEDREARKSRKEDEQGILPDFGMVLGGGIRIWFFSDDLEGGYHNGLSEFIVFHVLLDIKSRATNILNSRTGKTFTTFGYHSVEEITENIKLMALLLADRIGKAIKGGNLTGREVEDLVIDVFGGVSKWVGLSGDALREILTKGKEELDRLRRGERDGRLQDLLQLAILTIDRLLKTLKKP